MDPKEAQEMYDALYKSYPTPEAREKFVDSLDEEEAQVYLQVINTVEQSGEQSPVTIPGENAGMVQGTASNPIEENPEIDLLDRWHVQNLGNEAGSINYLQKKYPHLQFQMKDDEIIYQNREKGGPFYYMDPPTGGGGASWTDRLKEVGADVGDVGMDVVAGAAETAGTVAGGVGGFRLGSMTGPLAPAVVPALTVGGGMAGSGLTAGAMEALRQGLGVATGVNEGVNWDDAKTAGFWGGVAPLVPGSNMLPKKARNQAMEKVGQTATEFADQPVKAAWNTFNDAMSPLFGGTETGIRRQGRRYMDDIRRINKTPERPLEREAQRIGQELTDAVGAQKKRVGESIDREIMSVGEYDFADIAAELKGRIESLESLPRLDASQEVELKGLNKLYRKTFQEKFNPKALTEEEKEILKELGIRVKPGYRDIDTGAVPADKVMRMKTRVNTMRDGYRNATSPEDEAVYKQMANEASEIYGKMVGKMDEQGANLGPYNEEYQRLLGQEEGLERAGLKRNMTDERRARQYQDDYLFEDNQKGMRSLTDLGSQAKADATTTIENIDKALGTDYMDQANAVQAARHWLPKDKVPTGYGPRKMMGGNNYLLYSSLPMSGAGFYMNNPLAIAAPLVALGGKIGYSPQVTQKWLQGEATLRAFNDRLNRLPQAAQRALMQEYQPWFDQESGGQ